MGAHSSDCFSVLKQLRAPQRMTFRKGMELYGVYPSNDGSGICDEVSARYDADTGKVGKYFSTDRNIPLGMVLEYGERPDGKSMFLCKFELVDDVIAYKGKYSFRELDMEHFFQTPDDYVSYLRGIAGKMLDVEVKKSHNHFDDEMLPLDRNEQIYDIFWDEARDRVPDIEVFIGEHDLHKVKPVVDFERRAYTPSEAYAELDSRFPRQD